MLILWLSAKSKFKYKYFSSKICSPQTSTRMSPKDVGSGVGAAVGVGGGVLNQRLSGWEGQERVKETQTLESTNAKISWTIIQSTRSVGFSAPKRPPDHSDPHVYFRKIWSLSKTRKPITTHMYFFPLVLSFRGRNRENDRAKPLCRSKSKSSFTLPTPVWSERPALRCFP